MTVLVCLGSVALLIAVATLPALLLDLVSYGSRILRAVSRLRSRRSRQDSAQPEVCSPPIEQLAVQLRRLSAVLTAAGPVSSVRRFGVEQAYDEVLIKACGALGIEQQLDQVPSEDREFERLRVEAMVQEAGLVLRGPAGGVLPRRKPRQGEGLG
jgi:heme exporter protein D